MTNLSQKIIRSNLARYCKEMNRFLGLAEDLENEENGSCFGLSFLFLNAHRLTYSLERPNQDGSWEWLQDVMITLAEWDGERAFNQQEQSRIELFLIQMTILQNAPNSHDGIEKNLAEIFRQNPTEKYSLAGYFTANDFSKPISLPSQIDPTTLSNVLFRDHRLVFIVSHDHAMSLFKHDKKYYFCNPSAERSQEFDESQIDTLINQIFASNERYQADKPSPLGFFIFGFEENPVEYPTQGALLAQLAVQERGIDPTYMALNVKNTVLHLAATMGCLPSFNFYLAQPENRGFGSLTWEDNNGLIPIHNAAIKGHNNIVPFPFSFDRLASHKLCPIFL